MNIRNRITLVLIASVIATIALGGSVIAQSVAPSPALTVMVDTTNETGVHTGLMVHHGDMLRIRATGAWNLKGMVSTGPDGWQGPTTGLGSLKPESLKLPTAPIGMLIGRIGDWLFPIGSEVTIPVQLDGEVLLLVNAWPGRYGGGNGSLSVLLGLVSPDATDHSHESQLRPTVLAVAFTSYAQPIADPDVLTSEVIKLIQEASTYHRYKDLWSNPFLNFQIYGGKVIRDATLPPVLPNRHVDYKAIFDKYDVCDLVQQRAIEEVWLWAEDGNGRDKGYFNEWVATGPGWPVYWWPGREQNMPDCGRVLTTMYFNYTRDPSSALHSFGHRMEGFFITNFPCDFRTPSGPWQDYTQCGGRSSDLFGYTSVASDSHAGACGYIHVPPNDIDRTQYVYDEQRDIGSICPDWAEDGSAPVTRIDCHTWGCTDLGYFLWWMQNIPGYANTNRDRTGEFQPNWWPFLFKSPADGTASAIVTIRPSFTGTAFRDSLPRNDDGEYVVQVPAPIDFRAVVDPTTFGMSQSDVLADASLPRILAIVAPGSAIPPDIADPLSTWKQSDWLRFQMADGSPTPIALLAPRGTLVGHTFVSNYRDGPQFLTAMLGKDDHDTWGDTTGPAVVEDDEWVLTFQSGVQIRWRMGSQEAEIVRP